MLLEGRTGCGTLEVFLEIIECAVAMFPGTRTTATNHCLPSFMAIPLRKEGQTFEEWQSVMRFRWPMNWSRDADPEKIKQAVSAMMYYVGENTSPFYLAEYQKYRSFSGRDGGGER